MPILVLLKLAVFSQGLPALGALLARGRLSPPRRWTVAGTLVILSVNLVALAFAARGIHNLWTTYLFSPLEVGCLLIALSLWYPHQAARRLFWLAAALYLGWDVALLFFGFERLSEFSLILAPSRALLILGASLVTLLARLRTEPGRLFDADWFWISGALSLRYGVSAAIGPFGRIFLHDDQALVSAAYGAKAWIEILVALLLTRGLLCPVRPPASLPSTSPLSAPLSLS
jgi:hypothetical protein